MKKCLILITTLMFATQLLADDKIKFKVRLQPRLDAGEHERAGEKNYETESDIYLRRTRLEASGTPVDKLKYSLVLKADKWNQTGSADAVGLHYGYFDYQFATALGVRFGVAKLPYSRVSLTSSAKQLLVERPSSTEAGKKFFNNYYASHIMAHGKLADGAVVYNLAVTDGFQFGDNKEKVTHSGDPAMIGRIELSPPNWVEAKKNDAPLGKGRHLTLGLNAGHQRAIEFEGKAEDRTLLGADLSFHQKGVTLQTELTYMNRDNAEKVTPWGWYAQGGYFIEGLNLEPAARFEIYDKDSESDDSQAQIISGGVNWYKDGHGLKIQANVVHYMFDKKVQEITGDDSRTVIQVQGQMLF